MGVTVVAESAIRKKIASKEPVTSEDLEVLKKQLITREREVVIPKFYYIPIILLFVLSNIIVFGLVLCFSIHDVSNINSEGYKRFLTQPVIMSLIGGTVTQTGVAFYMLGKVYAKLERVKEDKGQ